jgi:hypothetical protein
MSLLDDLIAQHPDEYGQIKNQYLTSLGREPDPEGLQVRLSTLPGAGGSWTTDLSRQLSDIANSPEAQGRTNTSPGGAGIDLTAMEGLFPKSESFTGLPDWGQNTLKDYFSKNFGNYSDSLAKSLEALNSAPQTIENTRQSMIEQYKNAMGQNYNDMLANAISKLAGKGVLSSSTAEGTLSGIGKDLQNKYSDQVSNANTWAGNALLSNLGTNVTAQQKQMALLNSLLELAKTSTSTSSNALAPYSLLLPMLLGQ